MLDKLRKISKKKAELVEALEGSVVGKLSTLERKLFALIIERLITEFDTTKGVILFNSTNLGLIPTIDKIMEEFRKGEYLKVFQNHVEGYTSISEVTSTYFAAQVTKSRFERLESKVKRLNLKAVGLNVKGELVKGGFLETFFTNDALETEIKRVIIKNITQGTKVSDLKRDLTQSIISTERKNGLLKRYWRQHAFDTQQKFERNLSGTWAKELGLTAFLYSSNRVGDTRAFCLDHRGKIYTTTEAKEWKKLVNRKRGPIVKKGGSYDPLTDLGGINCMHSIDYISNELAASRRKDLKLNDKGELVKA